MGLSLRSVEGLPDAHLRPPNVARAGDPFAGLRVAHLICRLPRAQPVRLRDMVDQLNADYLDWSFSRPIVVGVLIQLQANWQADFRSGAGFEVREGTHGDEVTIEDSARVEPWLIRQAERYAADCRTALDSFARDEGAIP